MQILGKQRITLLAIAVLSFLMVSCGDNKITQCNKLSEIVNKAATEAQATDKSLKGNRLAELSKNAKNLDQYASELAGIPLKDSSLQGFQTRFVKMYRETSQASLALINAFEKKDVAAGSQAIQQWQQASNQENILVDEVNKYCGGGK